MGHILSREQEYLPPEEKVTQESRMVIRPRDRQNLFCGSGRQRMYTDYPEVNGVFRG